MLSLHNVSNAAQAQTYFAKDNYYTQDENAEHSAWFGKGAATLGLSGKVTPAQFMNLLEGRVGEQQLGKWVTDEKTCERRQEHQPGIDLTFSAPKSVSLLAEVAGDKDVRAAHERAAEVALTYIEEQVIRTRATKNGVTSLEYTGNMIVAMFRHNTSRDLDPQTHTHAVLINATQREDGQWRSIDNREIYQIQKLAGAIYNAELAGGLQQIGYRLTNPDKNGNFEIQGVSREQIEHFSQRRAAMKEVLEKQNTTLDAASAAEKERAALATRDRKKDVDHQELLDDWNARAEEHDIDLDGLRAATAKRKEDGIGIPQRLTGRDAMSFAAAQLIEREVAVDKIDLVKTAIEHGTGRVGAREVLSAFDDLEKKGDLIALPDDKYTTRKMFQSERWAIDFVRQQKDRAPIVLDAATVTQRIAASEKEQPFPYATGQKDAIVLALTSPDRFVAVQGLAGTGKTTMLRTLNDIAVSEGYVVRGMAPTGAASKIMVKETGIAADTVAMFQIKERQLQKDIEFAKQFAPDFVRRPELWVVDESSFLAQRQLAQIHNLAEKANAKVVYLGDKLQLQGVEAGKPFELAQGHGIATAHMTEINRQKTPHMQKAVDIITGRNLLKAGERLTDIELKRNLQSFDYLARQGKVTETEDVLGDAKSRYFAMSPEERAASIVITPLNKDRVSLNDDIRAEMWARRELKGRESALEILVSKGWTRAMIKEAQYYTPGDVVRFNRDYQQIDASKGDYARVLGVDHELGVVTIEKRDGTRLDWEPAKHNKVEVYDREQRQLAVGDVIRLTRNDDTFKNGETAKVIGLQGGLAVLEVSDKAATSHHHVNLNTSQHWDHAYTSTIHAAQGASKAQVIFVINMPDIDPEKPKQAEQMLAGFAKVFGDRSYYVGVTRASRDIAIVTNDVGLTRQAITQQQDKTTSIGAQGEHDRSDDVQRKEREI
ncbi:relaxase domain-containing protein (plasmid) [Burkholderia humptydooensis]|uniref:Relaxase domain-containing protein n=1 Tax=Burkholderia humptydooensis TaxID=430531 RepID=A0A7U4P7S2_9BURK|nr:MULTISPECIES: MobF family relaxase [Burkholderia]AJY38074.1 conjugative relaxase domain protein [Burkholderia sp. 2002721687]ALX44531.1 AAA family ATPase [Burkholderia humptydooensis]QPS41871.1 relaxase domain-containing protein [Burkholderia humptydooensis]